MARKTPLPGFDAKEVAFNVEAIRGFLFAAMLEAYEGMAEQGIAHADAALLTAAAEATAQLWAEVSHKAGIARSRCRTTLEKEIRELLTKHFRALDRGAPALVAS
jgi:hypothetical protein